MSFKKIYLILAIAFIFNFFGFAQIAQAGFGITSPYLENDRLVPGAHYEKKILIIRGDPVEDWQAEFSIDVPGANDWISFDTGKEFILPKGEKQVPVVISVDVPNDAKFESCRGAIRIKTLPLQSAEAGGVSIALGARINVDLEVIEEGIADFEIKNVKFYDIEEGWKIKIGVETQNTGNVSVAPTKIFLDVYDSAEQNKLVSLETTDFKEKVKPFETKELIAELDHQFKIGSYLVYFKVYNQDQVIKEGKLNLSILPPGTLPPQNEFAAGSFIGFLSQTQISPILAVIIIAILIAVFIFIFKIIKKKK